MKVLVACEESQRVCTAFRERGHEAYSCDIIECSGGHPEWHIQGDVLNLLYPEITVCSFDINAKSEMFGTFETCDGKTHELPPRWDLIIAHPPCTYLSNAGARWLWAGSKLNQERYQKGLEGKEFFMHFYNADCERIAIENPVPSSIYKLPKYTQVIEPYMFGHKATKKTCLWLKGLPPLKETNNVGRPEKVYFQKRDGTWRTDCWEMKNHGQKDRSKTFPGIAKAMAEQWG